MGRSAAPVQPAAVPDGWPTFPPMPALVRPALHQRFASSRCRSEAHARVPGGAAPGGQRVAPDGRQTPGPTRCLSPAAETLPLRVAARRRTVGAPVPERAPRCPKVAQAALRPGYSPHEGERKEETRRMSVLSPIKVDVERFEEEGYLVVDSVFDVERDLQPVVDEYSALIDELAARWYAEGKASSTYADRPFAERLGRLLSEVGKAGIQPLDISLPFAGVTEETPIHLGPATFRLLTHPRLLDVIEQVIGPEILSNPIQHVRIKPPERLLPPEFRNTLVGQTDWHQDQGVALPEVDETEMLTVWLPVTDATVENGCLCVVPRS